jgi:MoaA/NifB/PqqE/SkfB family radical SAM enzyme
MMRNQYSYLKLKIFLTALRKREITLRKLWNAAACSLSYFLQNERSGQFPVVLSLELGNDCNTSCLFCRDEHGVIFNINPAKPLLGGINKGKMPVDMAEDIIRQVSRDALIAVLYTNGEPLLYKDLGRVVRYSAERGLASMIATNGLLLDADNIRELLDSGIDFIKVQLSGFTQDVYSVQVRRGDVEQLKDNIRLLVKTRDAGRHETVIMADWISYQYNAHQLPLIEKFCRELGLMLNIRPGNPRGGLEDNEPALPTEQLPLEGSCDWPWKTMQVNYNGDILICCDGVVFCDCPALATYVSGKTDLKSVWNGAAFRNVRRSLKTQGRASLPLCAQCSRKGIHFKW